MFVEHPTAFFWIVIGACALVGAFVWIVFEADRRDKRDLENRIDPDG